MPDLDPSHLSIIQKILHEIVPERTVWLFGSRAKGQARPVSDADLVILGESPLGLKRLAALREAFESSDLPFRVDFIEWTNTSDAFKAVIQQDAVVIQK